MRAGRADVVHFPRARLVAILVAGERPHRADVNAHAALFAFECPVGAVGDDEGADAALPNAERLDVHGFVAHAHATEAEDAAGVVKIDDGRKLLLGLVLLLFDKAALGGAVAKHHVLEFALPAFVAHRAVERVIDEEEFQHALAGLGHLRRLGADDHAGLDHDRAGGLELGRLFDFHQAHPTGGLQ